MSIYTEDDELMPPSHRLTADEIEQAGRMLMPAFGDVVERKIDELEERLDAKYESRLKILETEQARQKGLLGKVMVVYGLISLGIGALWGTIVQWVKTRLTAHPQ